LVDTRLEQVIEHLIDKCQTMVSHNEHLARFVNDTHNGIINYYYDHRCQLVLGCWVMDRCLVYDVTFNVRLKWFVNGMLNG